MIVINIDPKKETASVKVDLVGESEAIELSINKYSIKGNQLYLKSEDIVINREWIKILAKNFLKDQEITLPIDLKDFIKILK